MMMMMMDSLVQRGLSIRYLIPQLWYRTWPLLLQPSVSYLLSPIEYFIAQEYGTPPLAS